MKSKLWSDMKTSARRIGILSILQLSNKMNLKIENKQRFGAFIALRLLMIVIASIILSFVLHVVARILYIPVDAYFMIFVLVITQGIGIVAATTGLLADLYHSKENQLLLSYPAKNDEVFISKLMVFYINEFLKNTYFLVPMLISFGYIRRAGFGYYFNILPMIVLLPFIVVLVAALISIPFMHLRNYLKDRNIVSVVLIFAFLGGVLYVVTLIVGQIDTPIRIIQLYNRFIINLTNFMRNVASYAAVYRWVGELLAGVLVFLNYIYLIVTVLVLTVSVFLISRPLYFKLASRSMEYAADKKHAKENYRDRHIFFTFLRKEMILVRRNLNNLIQDYSVLLTLPFFMYVLNFIYLNIDRTTRGNHLVWVFNFMTILFLTTASNTASATAITTEGTEFVLLKTAPKRTRTIAWAKITFNMVFSTVMIGLAFLVFRLVLPDFFIVFSALDVLWLYLLIVILNCGHILWSFQLDIINPQLSNYAATGSFVGNPNISKSITIGLSMSLFLGILAAILFLALTPLAWGILYMIAIAFLVVRFYYFNSYLKAYFMDIEF